MFRGAVTYLSSVGGGEDHHGTGWASAGAVIAVVSFAVDLTISLSGPQPAANQSTLTAR